MSDLLAPGQLVTPNLRLTRRLGAGGMGAVWIARHLGLKADVVVKFILGDRAQDASLRARFEREAAAAAEVRSPHVVQVFDHGVTATGLPYIVMELLEGEDLRALLQREITLELPEVAGLVLQVARALTRAHDRRVIHRDIKPDNLFLCDTGEPEAFVKVLDFGIAKIDDGATMGGATRTGAAVGTPLYMAPEQLIGSKTIDHRADLWSLGVVAFQALTGEPPFVADTIGGLAVKVHSEPFPDVTTIVRGAPRALDEWFQRACARDAEARFPNARAMAEALCDLVGGAGNARLRARPAARAGAASLDGSLGMSLGPLASSPGGEDPTLLPTEIAPLTGGAAASSTTVAPPEEEPAPLPVAPARRVGLWVAGGLVMVAATVAAIGWARRGGEPSAAPVASASQAASSATATATTPASAASTAAPVATTVAPTAATSAAPAASPSSAPAPIGKPTVKAAPSASTAAAKPKETKPKEEPLE